MGIILSTYFRPGRGWVENVMGREDLVEFWATKNSQRIGGP